MSPSTGVVIMLNNYFHDVATALLLACGVAMWLIYKQLGNVSDEAVLSYFNALYKSMTRLAKFSLVWIVIGGVPRTIFYREFEWAAAAGKNQVPALVVKHILAFIFVVAGAVLWIRINKKVRATREYQARARNPEGR